MAKYRKKVVLTTLKDQTQITCYGGIFKGLQR